MIEQTAEYYNKRWENTIKLLPKGGDYRNDLRSRGWQLIADYIGNNKKVFDFATGVSNLPKFLQFKECDVYGCDFSEVAVGYASQYGNFKVSGEIYGEGYDFITACQFLEHIDNPVEWVANALTKCKELIISIPNNFRQQGDHYLMQWSNWDEFNNLFTDFNMERIDTKEAYNGIHEAWNHPTFVFTKK